MSTRLEQAQKDYEDGVITHRQHQAIVIEERNKEILGLQARLREADKRIRELESARPEGVFIPKDIADFCLESAMMLRHRLEIAPNSPEYRRVCEVQTKLEDAISRLEPQKER